MGVRNLMSSYKLTPDDNQLIKNGLRSAFARSQLHREVINAAILPNYSDPSRPRVKTWVQCYMCKKAEAKSYMQVDHIHEGYVPLGGSFDQLTPHEMIYRLWCGLDNLGAICKPCHKVKSGLERKARAALKKAAAKASKVSA